MIRTNDAFSTLEENLNDDFGIIQLELSRCALPPFKSNRKWSLLETYGTHNRTKLEKITSKNWIWFNLKNERVKKCYSNTLQFGEEIRLENIDLEFFA